MMSNEVHAVQKDIWLIMHVVAVYTNKWLICLAIHFKSKGTVKRRGAGEVYNDEAPFQMNLGSFALVFVYGKVELRLCCEELGLLSLFLVHPQ